MIEEMLEAKSAMTRLHKMINDIVSDAGSAYRASDKQEDKVKWCHLMDSRAAICEAIYFLAAANGEEILPYESADQT